jgi:hypothetical protein
MNLKTLLATTLLAVTMATAQAANPLGVYCLLPVEDGSLQSEKCWGDSHIKGVVIRDWWSNVELTQGSYYWNYYDQGLKAAASNGKQVIAVLSLGVEAPSWLYTANPPVAAHSTPDGTMPTPWDQNFYNYTTRVGYFDTIVHKFMNHLHASQYASVVAAVSVWDGGESGTEDFFNCTNGTEAAKWQQAAENLGLDWYYNAWFPMFLSAGNPYPGDGGVTMTTVANYLLADANTAGSFIGLETNGASDTFPSGSYFAHTNVPLTQSGWTCYQDVKPIIGIGTWLVNVENNVESLGAKVWEVYKDDWINDPGIGRPGDSYQGDAALQKFNAAVGAPNP